MKLDKLELACVIVLLVLLSSVLTAQAVIHQTSTRIQELNYNLEVLDEQNALLEVRVSELSKYIEEWYTQWDISEFEVSAYAPLDPGAIEGMCYSGNPAVTASGAKTKPGVTIAVDPTVIPLGSRVYIEGVGWRIAEDTGGLIKGNKIDLCMTSRTEAFKWGRRTVTVIH